MIFSRSGKSPEIHPTAWVASDATICGDVVIGPDCRILHGARIIAEGGQIEIGTSVIVLENAVVRSTIRHSTQVGDHCLVGPNAHLVGCKVDAEVFLATGCSIFHGSRIGRGSEVRVNGVVHVKTNLLEKTTVPIGWVAVGDPCELFSPDRHEEIWARQAPMNFPLEAYGLMRQEANMRSITKVMSEDLGTRPENER